MLCTWHWPICYSTVRFFILLESLHHATICWDITWPAELRQALPLLCAMNPITNSMSNSATILSTNYAVQGENSQVHAFHSSMHMIPSKWPQCDWTVVALLPPHNATAYLKIQLLRNRVDQVHDSWWCYHGVSQAVNIRKSYHHICANQRISTVSLHIWGYFMFIDIFIWRLNCCNFYVFITRTGTHHS